MQESKTKLNELIEELLAPELIPLSVIRSDGTEENFSPLTLFESFIESEMDVRSAAHLFDIVRDKIDRLKTPKLNHKMLQAIVEESILESSHDNKLQWLRNYSNIFGADIESEPEDETYVFARSAGILKAYLVRQICDNMEFDSLEKLESILGKSEIDAATNRLRKAIRYCGFYKVPTEFLKVFVSQLALYSIKGQIPYISKDPRFIALRIEDAEMLLACAKRDLDTSPAISRSNLQLALEQIAQALIVAHGLVPRTSSLRSFHQLIELLSDGQRIVASDPNGAISNFAGAFYEKISSKLHFYKVPFSSFLDLCQRLNSDSKRGIPDVSFFFDYIGRLLRIARILLSPAPRIDILRAISLSETTVDHYLKLVREILQEQGYYADWDKTHSVIDIDIGRTPSNLIQFGDTIRVIIPLDCKLLLRQLNMSKLSGINDLVMFEVAANMLRPLQKSPHE